MERCPHGSTRIGKRLALRVLDWHGGQSRPTYAVGSSGFADRCVSKDLVRRAASELNVTLIAIRKGIAGRYTARDERGLARIVEVLRRKGS